MARPTSRDVLRALYWHFTPRYAVLTELTTTDHEARAAWLTVGQLALADMPDPDALGPTDRRIDVLLWRPDDRIAVEVKVDKADLLADVADPAKQRAWRLICHRHAYAVPERLLADARMVVPPESGIISVRLSRSDNHGFWRHDGVEWDRRIRKGPDPGPLPDRLTKTVMIRLARAEASLKGYIGHYRDDDLESLRARAERAEADLVLALGRVEMANSRADEWRRRFASVKAVPCRWCAAPLVPDHNRRRFAGWRHQRPEDEVACEPLREHAWDGPFPADPT